MDTLFITRKPLRRYHKPPGYVIAKFPPRTFCPNIKPVPPEPGLPPWPPYESPISFVKLYKEVCECARRARRVRSLARVAACERPHYTSPARTLPATLLQHADYNYDFNCDVDLDAARYMNQ